MSTAYVDAITLRYRCYGKLLYFRNCMKRKSVHLQRIAF